jgi:hypothetical protein
MNRTPSQLKSPEIGEVRYIAGKAMICTGVEMKGERNTLPRRYAARTGNNHWSATWDEYDVNTYNTNFNKEPRASSNCAKTDDTDNGGDE